MKCSLGIFNFLEEISSLSHSILFSSISLHWSLKKAFLSILAVHFLRDQWWLLPDVKHTVSLSVLQPRGLFTNVLFSLWGTWQDYFFSLPLITVCHEICFHKIGKFVSRNGRSDFPVEVFWALCPSFTLSLGLYLSARGLEWRQQM